MTEPRTIAVTLPEGTARRLDKALADAVPAEAHLSRSRLQALIAAGAVARAGVAVTDASAPAEAGQVWIIALPGMAPAGDAPEDIALDVVWEDADLAVIDKPAGLVVHPAPGAATGTLVNALLHRMGDSLSGVGGERRPGIVHRIDRETSGLLVVAKTDRAHHALSAQFAVHTAERSYLALAWGAPDQADPRLMGMAGVSAEPGGVIRIEGAIGRHPTDRKRMAVVRAGGRRAVTRVRVLQRFGGGARPAASLVECRLETGRTHQIRVHLAHAGHPLIGDPVYGRARKVAKDALPGSVVSALVAFPRQALHAATLGFRHPDGGEMLQFSSKIPADFNRLLTLLQGSGA
jgi:23S rRNA pseudouridine1911/1915/1917 synthase